MELTQYPFTEMAEKVLRKANHIARITESGAVSTEHLLLAFFEVPCMPASVMKSQGITREKVTECLEKLLGDHFRLPEKPVPVRRGRLPYTPLMEILLQESIDMSRDTGSGAVGTEQLFLVLLQDMDGVAAHVFAMLDIDAMDIIDHLLSSMGDSRYALDDILSEPQVGTENVAQYTRDLTALAQKGKLEPVIGREKELRRVIQILSRRTKNNPCLIGEPGVGKTAVTEALAQRIAAGKVPGFLRSKRILSLNLASVVAGTKYRGEFEERMKTILDEFAAHPEIILFIDEIHTLIGAGAAEGSLDAANILKPALSRGEIQVIGATTLDEYRKHIEKDTALKRRFQSILIEEPTDEETLEVLKGRRYLYEEHHRLRISDDALAAAVRLSRRYITDRLFPDKALDLLDEACSGARLNAGPKEEILLEPQHIAQTVSLWTGIPLNELSREEGARLTELESVIHKRVIGQEEAVSALAKAIRRSRVGLKDPRRPIGTFLFLGPTGVGKTELSKALAVALFGDEKDLIRIDMSEYMEKHSVSKLIGSPPGYVGFEEGGQLSERIRRKPYSVILFDEIEKAHPDVFHILLQVLDEGRLTDSQGTTVDFRNTVIIMTSNAGAERIVEPKSLGFAAVRDAQADHERMKAQVMEEVHRIFRPEFINRIDEIIVFRMLNREDIRAILDLQLKDIENRLQDSAGLSLKLTEEAAAWFTEKGYEPKYGARPLKRLLQTELEDRLAEAILSGQIRSGDEVLIGIRDGKPCLGTAEKAES